MSIKYIPKHLTKKDKKKQKSELTRSKRLYKKGKYYTRKKIKSFRSKPSKHVVTAKKMYNVKKIIPNKTLSEKTGCSIKSLNKIVNKGMGAYYSSGSRPNQTSTSWGIARLASSITGGNSSIVDFHIIKDGCDKKKKAYKLALQRVKDKKDNKN